jgi:hypothetical protein
MFHVGEIALLMGFNFHDYRSMEVLPDHFVVLQKSGMSMLPCDSRHMFDSGEDIVLAEDQRTAAMYHQVFDGKPVLIYFDEERLGKITLPPLPSEKMVFILKSYDPAGVKEADMIANRWRAQGREVQLVMPTHPDGFTEMFCLK